MKRLARLVLGALLAVGILAPLLANDLPIVARVGGAWCFPAFASYLGVRPDAPGDGSWKGWWASGATEQAGDWAVMPPIPYGPGEPHHGRINAGPEFLTHYMGNDDTGRDVLAQVVHGTGTAVTIGLGVVLLAALIGVPVGALAGWYGGLPDLVLGSLVQLFLCFPPFFFVLAASTFLGSSLASVVLVLGLLYWVSFARIVRGEVLRLRDREFVVCARGLGVSSFGLLARHILPAARGPLLVNAAFVAASAIVVEATLSFLGLGPGLATVSWGRILLQGREYASTGAWHLWLFPSIPLVATVFSLHTWVDRDGG